MKRITIGVAAAGILAGIGGCSSKPKPAPLKPQAFQPAPQRTTAQTPAPLNGAAGGPATPAEQALPAPAPASAAPPPSPSASRPAIGDSSGTYLLVGAVIAEANGKAIYADKVLGKVETALAAEARRNADNSAAYRAAAATLVRRAVDEAIHDELEFAAAQRSNAPEDDQFASGLTTQWRQKEITKAGGSLAVARRISMYPTDGTQGMDFDEKVQEQYRRFMVLIYYRNKVWPRVQVLADDLRYFYDRNPAVFTDKAAVRFRVLRKGITESGGGNAEKAFERAKDIHERATKNPDSFPRLAMTENDHRSWARNGGYMEMVDEQLPAEPAAGDDLERAKRESQASQNPAMTRKVPAWYDKGALKVTALEEALFALSPGQITPIVDGRDGYYYIARLEEKKDGRTREFTEREVQDAIRRRLETEQRQELRKKEQFRLMNASVVRMDDKMMQAAVDMAMQKFAMWTRK